MPLKTLPLAILPFLLLCQFALAERIIQLDDSYPIIVTPTRDISSAYDHTGTPVTFKLLQDCKVDGKVLIPLGTVVNGKIEFVKHSKAFGRKGKLDIHFDHVSLKGIEIPIRTDLVKAGHLKKTTVDKVISFLPYGIGRIGNGKDAIISIGTPLTLFIDGTFKFRVPAEGEAKFLKAVKAK